MDAKITKKRLSRMLSYDWVKMVVIAAAIIILWTLIFTMTATRITPAQQYTVFNYDGNLSFRFTKFEDAYDEAYEKGIFSHEVLENTKFDMTTAGSDIHTVMDARMQTDEGDAIFVSKQWDPDTGVEQEDGTVKYEYTYLQTFIARYSYYLYDINDYLAYMETYLNGYYKNAQGNPDYRNGVLDVEKVEADFREREKGDKRFKTEKQKKAGVLKDIERIEKYRAALIQFNEYVDQGVIALEYTTIKAKDENGEEVVILDNKAYSINLCPTEATSGLKDYVAYIKTEKDEEGADVRVETAANMQLCLFDLSGVNKNFLGENLIFINQVVEWSLEASLDENK